MEKLYTSKTFSKMVSGRMHTPHPTPGYASGHKKESGIFQSLSTINLVLFLVKGRVKGKEDMVQCSPPKYAPDGKTRA